MKINETGVIPRHVMTALQEAALNAATGVRDPDQMRTACEEMDRIREENRRKFGIQDVGVSIIREMRDAE